MRYFFGRGVCLLPFKMKGWLNIAHGNRFWFIIEVFTIKMSIYVSNAVTTYIADFALR